MFGHCQCHWLTSLVHILLYIHLYHECDWSLPVSLVDKSSTHLSLYSFYWPTDPMVSLQIESSSCFSLLVDLVSTNQEYNFSQGWSTNPEYYFS